MDARDAARRRVMRDACRGPDGGLVGSGGSPDVRCPLDLRSLLVGWDRVAPADEPSREELAAVMKANLAVSAEGS